MIKRLINLTASLIVSVFLILALVFFSRHSNKLKNSFIRFLPPHKLTGENFKDIKYNAWYIGGTSNSEIYLGNNIVPGKIAIVDRNLRNYSERRLTGYDTVQIHKGAYIQIDSPSFYLMDGVKPLILRANIGNLNLKQQLKATYFTGGISITSNSMVLRSIFEGTGAVLIKKNLESGTIKMTKLLQRQIDGVFCTDGDLFKVPGTAKMIYVYYYRNQFLCVDSNMNLLYKGKTIDTISRAQIKVAKITSTGETTLAAPPVFVNKRACANEKYLFVQSALRADNETEAMIKDVSMVDVYGVSEGKYQFSFYLPDFLGFKVRDFKVYGQSLYALYDHYLYKYQLNF